MDVLFLGSKDRGVRCLEALLDADVDVVGVVTVASDDPNRFWEGSVEAVAVDHDVPTSLPEDVNQPSVVDDLRSFDADLFVMSGYNQVLGPDVLAIPEEGVINLHAGKLPAYRGGSPMNWAIINGESEGTATIHYATEKIDAGAILAEEPFPIHRSDTIRDVRERTLEVFPDMLVDVVERIERGEQRPREQDVGEGAYWGSRIPEDGRIHWDRMTARNVYDMVRALTRPYPGAYTTYRGERVYIWKADLIDETIKQHPGRVCMARDGGRVVTAADRGLLLERIQPEGAEEQPAADYLERGAYLR